MSVGTAYTAAQPKALTLPSLPLGLSEYLFVCDLAAYDIPISTHPLADSSWIYCLDAVGFTWRSVKVDFSAVSWLTGVFETRIAYVNRKLWCGGANPDLNVGIVQAQVGSLRICRRVGYAALPFMPSPLPTGPGM